MLVKLLENLRIFKTNGTAIQKFSAFLKLLEISRQYLLLRTVILRLGAPEDNYIEFMDLYCIEQVSFSIIVKIFSRLLVLFL